MNSTSILIAAIGLVVGIVAAFAYQNYLKKKLPEKEAPKEAKESDTRAKEIILEARDEAFRIKREAEEEVRRRTRISLTGYSKSCQPTEPSGCPPL